MHFFDILPPYRFQPIENGSLADAPASGISATTRDSIGVFRGGDRRLGSDGARSGECFDFAVIGDVGGGLGSG